MLPGATASDDEELTLAETGTPGVFERTSLPTGAFLCTVAPTAPARGNGTLEFARNPRADAPGCFGERATPVTLTGRLTVTFTDLFTAQGRTNVERQATAATTCSLF